MVQLSDPAITRQFKSVFTRLRCRNPTDCSKAGAASMAACVSDVSEIDLEVEGVTVGLQEMALDNAVSLPIAPSGTFDFQPPASSPKWPGPRYDDLMQFVPGIFDRPQDKPSKSNSRSRQKRAAAKRRSSQDDKHSQPSSGQRRLNSRITKATKKKQTTPRKPQFYQSPRRAEPLHLLSLPGEIRNQIYRLLFVSKAPLKAQYRPVLKPHSGGQRPEIRRFPREPVLALVCRQLRNEATSYFYAENKFIFAKSQAMISELQHPPQAAMTKSEMLSRWKHASTTEALTHVEVHFRADLGGFDDYDDEAFKYIIRRLADRTVDVQIESDTARCACFDQNVCKQMLPLVKARGRATSLMAAAVVLVLRREMGLQKEDVVKGETAPLLTGRPRPCALCGKRGWRRLGRDD